MTNERTSLFLMANLGAETARLVAARERKDREETGSSLARAEHILDEVLALPEMKSRQEELAILRDSLKNLALEQESASISPLHLKSYFTPFALRLMTTR